MNQGAETITEIYYHARFKLPLQARTKIRKVWTWQENAGSSTQTILRAIQILENGDNELWGVFKRNDNFILQDGNYTLKLQEFKPNIGYDDLELESGIDANFFIGNGNKDGTPQVFLNRKAPNNPPR